MAGAEAAQEAALGILLKALLDQLPDHGNKDRVGPDRGNPNHVHAQVVRSVLGLDVEIEEHFEMVRDEPDRDPDHVLYAGLVQSVQLVQNVGLEPWDVRWTAAALPSEPVASGAGKFRNESADFVQLALVGGAFGHRDRNAMRREDDLSRVTAILRQ